MKNFYSEHPVITMVIGAAFTVVANYVGGAIIGKGLGQLIVNDANEVCDDEGVPHIE